MFCSKCINYNCFRSEVSFFKAISDLNFFDSDPNFRSEICIFLSRSDIKNLRSENQLIQEIINFRSCTESALGTGELFNQKCKTTFWNEKLGSKFPK